MFKSLHEIAKDYIKEVSDSLVEISKMSNATEEADAKNLYTAIQKAERSIRNAGSKARGAIADNDNSIRREIFSS